MREFKDLKIAVAGTGYVGLSIATLLSQHHKVTAVDIVPEKVELINNKKSPIQDEYIEKYLAEKNLDLTATLDAKEAYSDADFVVIAAPTNYDSNKITCIPTFTASKSEVGKPQVGTYGLYFGRVTEEKGVDTVVKAYEMMPDRHVKIMGDDTTDEAKRLKAYIKEKKIKNVEFLGFKAGEELEEIIKGARFTLIPSIWYDNLPNTALESFQYSKPVIASNIGSLPELVLDGVNGYLFKPADARELCEKVALDMGQLLRLPVIALEMVL